MSWTWHRVATVILSLFALIVSGISAYYYNKIRLNPDKCSELSSSERLTGLWLNIILAILSGMLFFWTLLESGGVNSTSPDKIVHTQTNIIRHEPEVSSSMHGQHYVYEQS